MEKLLVGKIIDTFSLDGSFKVFSTTSNPETRYQKGNKLLLKQEGLNDLIVTVENFRHNGRVDLLKFEEISDPDQAKLYKGAELLVDKDYKDLNEGYYFYSDLVGCSLISQGKKYGKVMQIEEFPAQITLRCLSNENKEFFVPFIAAFINKVDIENKVIDFNYMEGML